MRRILDALYKGAKILLKRVYTLSYPILWEIADMIGKTEPVVFYAHYPSFYVNFQDVHQFFPQMPVVASREKGVFHGLKRMGINVRRFPGFPRVVVSGAFPDGTYPYRKIKQVNVFHGVAEKNYTYSTQNRLFDFHLVPGRYMEEKLHSAGYTNTKVVGFPKLDRLFTGSLNKDEIIKNLGGDISLPTLLYAPTCRDDFNSLPYVAESLAEIANQVNVLVKLHPGYSPEYRDDGIKWINLFKSTPGVILIEDYADAVPYMYASDMLLTDASSIIFEFAALDRPVILFDVPTPLQGIGGYDTQGIEQRWRDIGIRIKSPKDLKVAVQDAIRNPTNYSDKRKQYTQQLFYKLDGKSAERTAEALQDYVRLAERTEPHPLEPLS